LLKHRKKTKARELFLYEMALQIKVSRYYRTTGRLLISVSGLDDTQTQSLWHIASAVRHLRLRYKAQLACCQYPMLLQS